MYVPAQDYREKCDRDKIAGSPEGADEVKAMLPEVREALGAMDELQSFDAYTRNEGGRVRTSMLFKVK